MEASGTLGGGESAAEGTQTGSEQQEQTQQAPDNSGYDRLAEQFQGFVQDFGDRFSALEQRFAGDPEDDQQEEEAPFSPDEFFQEDGSLTPESLMEWIDQAAEKKAREFVGPLQQQMQQSQAQAEQRRLEQAADELEQKYPIIGDEEYQERFIQTAQQQAMALAQSIGNPDLAEILWKQPEFLENIHLALQARERAENEVPAGSENGIALERGNSLGPTGSGDSDEDIAKRIVSAKG